MTIKTPVPNEQYLDNYDRIFGKLPEHTHVFIFRECDQYIMWDREILEHLPQPEEYLLPVPSKFVKEYNELMLAYSSMQARLKEYYECAREQKGPTQSTLQFGERS